MLWCLLFAFVWGSWASSCTITPQGSTTPIIVPGCQTVLSTPAEFIALSNKKGYVKPSTPPSKVTVGPGAKILFDFRDESVVRDRTWFIDTALYPSHSNFIQAMGEWANYQKDTRPWFRCDWQSYIDLDNKWVFGITINVGFPVGGDLIMKLCRNVAVGLKMRFTEKNGWISIDPSTQKFNQTVIDYCKTFGLVVMDIDDLFQGTIQQFSPLHTGEAYGILRMFPTPAQTDLLAPRDIPVFNFLPLNLGVVQGVITSVFQTTNSHVNLKSNERNTPNMILLNIASYPCINALDGKPVHFQVSKDGWGIEPTTMDKVDAWIKNQLNREKWLQLYHTNLSECRSFDSMCPPNDPGSCIEKFKGAYGTKASSLGFLRNPLVLGTTKDPGSLSASLGYNITVPGFGVPMQYYIDFINYPANIAIKNLIEKISNAEMAGEVPEQQRYDDSVALKKLFWNAQIPPHVYNNILQACYKFLYPHGITLIKLRSSSNAEDLPGFDGAGLYDSFPADYTKDVPGTSCVYDAAADAMIPETLACALKGIYGSLWNIRAIAERTYARFVHNTCAMAIAVNPRYTEYGTVVANAVAITKNLEPTIPVDTAAYTFSIQAGDNDVTNPDPGTTAESQVCVFEEDGSEAFKVIRYAQPEAGLLPLTQPVLNRKLMSIMLQIVKKTEYAYCVYFWKVNPAICQLAPRYWRKTGLDTEFKFVQLDSDPNKIHVINKQLREFSGQAVDKTIVNVSGTCKYISTLYFPQPPGKQTINVALNKNANSSATYLKGSPNKAIDGDATGDNYNSALVSANGIRRYWLVDLLKDYIPIDVRVFTVTVGANYVTQMNNFDIQFLDKKGVVLTTIPLRNKGAQKIIEWQDLNYQQKIRYVRLIGNVASPNPVLAMAEVQIWAPAFALGNERDFPRAIRPVTPSPCVWDQWGDWSPCSATCGVGFQTRKRGPDFCITHNTNASYETKQCASTPCPLPCIGYWGPWTKCNCDAIQYSTFHIRRAASFGGLCEAKEGQTQSQTCQKPFDCPVNCNSRWTPWGACSCKTQQQSRTFQIDTPAAFGGIPCEFPAGTPQTRACTPTSCPVDCDGTWDAWTSCSCLTKTQSRTFNVVRAAEFGGAPCPNPLNQNRACAPTGCSGPQPVPTYSATVTWDYSQTPYPTTREINDKVNAIISPSSVTTMVSIDQATGHVTAVFTSDSQAASMDAATKVSNAMKNDPAATTVSEPTQQSNNPTEGNSTNVGLVVGVAIGCFVGVLIIGALLIHFLFPSQMSEDGRVGYQLYH